MWQLFFGNQLKPCFSWVMVRTFVAMGCYLTYISSQRNERLKTAVSVNAMVICAM